VEKMGNKNGNVRIIARIERIMKGQGVMTTREIYSGLRGQKTSGGKSYTNQPTMHELGNFLAKGSQFRKISSTKGKVKCIRGFEYGVAEWILDEEE
tara:strand:- start:2298 stop:2585 length:288 start_codon:yes stop_codon:yes gene_type:complete